MFISDKFLFFQQYSSGTIFLGMEDLQFGFQTCLESGDGSGTFHYGTEDREFQTAGAMQYY